MPTQANRLIPFLLGAVLAAASALAQSEAPAQNPAEFSEVGRQAYERLRQDDATGAIELLERQRQTGAATHVDLALLGTLYLEAGRAAEALDALRAVADGEAADPAVLYNAGRAALAVGEAAAAEAYLERSVAKVAVSPATRELGLLRGAQGRVADSFLLLRAWVAQNLGDVPARIALIAAGLTLGHGEEVAPLFQGLPDEPRVALLRAQYLSQTGDPQSAIVALERLREAAPPELRTDVLRVLAGSYLRVGRAGDAVALLDGRVDGDPRLALLLAEAHREGGDLAAAAAALEPFARQVTSHASAGGPVAYRVLLDYGRALASTGRAADALPYLERAAEIGPREQLAWESLGEALTAAGRDAEAGAARESLRRLAEEAQARRQAAEAAAQDPVNELLREVQEAVAGGEPQKALAVLRQEIALTPDDVRPRLLEVRLLASLERYEDALRSCEATVERFPDNVDAYYQRGVVRMALEDAAAAEQDLRRALELVPEHVPALNDLAVVVMMKGEKEEARELFERLLRISPNNELALRNLQRLSEDG
ncbi:MAG TPA: tetratricopeptide repeat protein [Thermoanaerobaculia bacterium]|jgi:tetratricopeptide (TPR) repeat protein